MSDIDGFKIPKSFKNIQDEMFKALCCNTETATDLVNIWISFVLNPKYEIKNIYLYVPEEEYKK